MWGKRIFQASAKENCKCKGPGAGPSSRQSRVAGDKLNEVSGGRSCEAQWLWVGLLLFRLSGMGANAGFGAKEGPHLSCFRSDDWVPGWGTDDSRLRSGSGEPVRRLLKYWRPEKGTRGSLGGSLHDEDWRKGGVLGVFQS